VARKAGKTKRRQSKKAVAEGNDAKHPQSDEEVRKRREEEGRKVTHQKDGPGERRIQNSRLRRRGRGARSAEKRRRIARNAGRSQSKKGNGRNEELALKSLSRKVAPIGNDYGAWGEDSSGLFGDAHLVKKKTIRKTVAGTATEAGGRLLLTQREEGSIFLSKPNKDLTQN